MAFARRTRAGALALLAAVFSPAGAAKAQEGPDLVDQPHGVEGEESADADAGLSGDEVVEVPETQPAAPAGPLPDEAPLEPDVLPDEEAEQPGAAAEPVTEPVVEEPVAPPPPPAPAPPAPVAAPPAPPPPAAPRAQPPRPDRPTRPREPRPAVQRQAPSPPPRPAAPPPARRTVAEPAPATVPPPPPPPASSHEFVVRQGDSLWSIAADLVDDGASPQRIAAMVDQLWRLNSGRIRSGSRDVIQPGERLLLPGGP